MKTLRNPVPGIVGHRGAGHLAPENTLAALYTAIRMGVAGIECDAQSTVDGRIVLFHDTTLERTTSGFGTLAEASLDELQSLDAGSWFDYLYGGEVVPTLDEALDLINGRLIAFIELKQPSFVEKTAAIIESYRAESWCRVISFSEYVLAQTARRLPDVPRTYLINPDTAPDPIEVIEKLQAIPADMVGLPSRWLDDDLTGRIKQAGFGVMTGPVDSEESCQEALLHGADFLLTNQPRLIQSCLVGQESD